MWTRTRARTASLTLSAATAAMLTAGCMTALVPTADAAELRTYGECDALLDRLREVGREHAGEFGFDGDPEIVDYLPVPDLARPDAAADKAAPETAASGTNVQEAGVDEDDSVEAGPGRLLILSDSVLRYVDVTTGSPVLRGTTRFDFDAGTILAGADRVLVVGTETDVDSPRVVVAEVDVSDPDSPHVGASVRVEGTLTAARASAGVARVVVDTDPDIAFVSPGSGRRGGNTAAEANRAAVDASTLKDWLPEVEGAPAPACNRVMVPREFAGTGMLTVLSLDLEGPLRVLDQTSLLTRGEIVYQSASTLYVAKPSATSTTVHAFDVTGRDAATYQASGRVDGRVDDRWSLSESADVLRVVTTDTSTPGHASSLTTMRREADRLVQAGRVGGIGHNEQVKAVRFVGDTGYVVTFKRTDPLWVLDLRDPERPRVAGELHVPGYSNYLHPVADGTLVGVGQDADPQTGRPLGLKVSSYDVSDPGHPKQTASWSAGPAMSSPAEDDPHAFLWWEPTGTVAVPLSSGGEREVAPADVMPTPHATETVVLNADHGTLEATGRITCPTGSTYAETQRSAVVGDVLFAVCTGGVSGYRLDGLTPTGAATWG